MTLKLKCGLLAPQKLVIFKLDVKVIWATSPSLQDIFYSLTSSKLSSS